jgi:hypothetical protein
MLDQNNQRPGNANTNANEKKPAQGSGPLWNDFLQRAQVASDDGEPILASYMYLAAFEQAQSSDARLTDDVIDGLKEAWVLACECKERSLAEYIFDLLDPFLTDDELNMCTDRLQELALDKLAEYGLSRDDLMDMASAFGDQIMDLSSDDIDSDNVAICKIEQLERETREVIENIRRGVATPEDLDEAEEQSEQGLDDASAAELTFEPSDNTTEEPAEDTPTEAEVIKPTPRFKIETIDTKLSRVFEKNDKKDKKSKLRISEDLTEDFLSKTLPEFHYGVAEGELLNYSNLVGYDETVASMRDLGFGMSEDQDYQKLVEHLNFCHGLKRMPAMDTLLFSCEVREDANHFVFATLGELSLPTVYMRMDQSSQELPILCVSAHAQPNKKIYSLPQVLDKGGVLVLENLDLWRAPVFDMPDEGSLFTMQFTRGAREALSVIQYAQEQPNVYVFATCANPDQIDPFFLDMLEPITMIDIDLPTAEDRVAIWLDLARRHPSIDNIKKADLVRMSANLPRCDIYMAASDALDEAYKQSLVSRVYKPISRQNIFDKLAAYQAVDSEEYELLIDAVIDDFRDELANIDDILKEE